MTLYTAFERILSAGCPAALDRETVPGLDQAATEVLSALFDADGATPEALSARTRTTPSEVDGALGTLGRLGYVEHDGRSAWLTGEAFGLRRSVRRAAARVAVPFRRGAPQDA